MKIRGSGLYTDANGKRHRVAGISEWSEAEKFRELKVSGNLSFEKISCEEIELSGKCEGAFVTAKNFSASGKVEVDSMSIEQLLKLSGKPKINAVEADEIIIAARNGFIDEIKCRVLRIFENSEKIGLEVFEEIFGKHFPRSEYNLRVKIKKIDAETVELENCTVDVIRCKDAFIGSNCSINKLFFAGECKIADDSTVGETIHT